MADSAVPHIGALASTFPEYKIKQLIHARCKGASYVGIQSGFGLCPDQVLFNLPGRGPVTTLCVPRRAFDVDCEAAIALVQHKIFLATTKEFLNALGVYGQICR